MGKYDHMSLDDLIEKARVTIGLSHIDKLISITQKKYIDFTDKQGLHCAACHQEKMPDGLINFELDISEKINQDYHRKFPIGLKTPSKGWHFTFWLCDRCRAHHLKNPFEVRFSCLDFWCLKSTGRGLLDADDQSIV